MKPTKDTPPSPSGSKTIHLHHRLVWLMPAEVAKRCFCIAWLAAALMATRAAPPSLQPLPKGHWPVESGMRVTDVKVVGRYAYLALASTNYDSGGFAVVDVSNPTNCVRVGGCANFGAANGVAVSGSYAYVADSGDEGPLPGAGLQVIDVSNPANCVRVGGYVVTNGYASGVAVSGNYAYIAAGGRWTGSNYIGVFEVVDVGNPTLCVRVGGVNTLDEALEVAVSGSFAFVADGSDAGMRVINVSNPSNCVVVGGARYELSHDTYAVDVAVSGNYAYVADFYAGLKVFDVRNPTNCVAVGSSIINGYALGVAVSGKYAFMSVVNRGPDPGAGYLQVIDVSDPTRCVRQGSYGTGGRAQKVDVGGGQIYVANDAAGLLVLPTLRDLQFTVRVDATPGVPFTIETATNLGAPMPWAPLFTTNVATMPFDYVDFDVRMTNKPQKSYRVRQP